MSPDVPLIFQPILNQLNISDDQCIGKGIEGYVFKYRENKAVKIYFKTTRKHLEELRNLQIRLSQSNLPYSTPLIESFDVIEGVYYSIENRLVGKNAEEIFSTLSSSDQSQLIKNFLTALIPLQNVNVSDFQFGQILHSPGSLRSSSWKEFLLNKLQQKIKEGGAKVEKDVVNHNLKIMTLEKMIQNMIQNDSKKNFIHGDYYLANTLVNKDLEITAILDLNIHTSVGDYRLDIANISFQSLFSGFTAQHLNLAKNLAIEIFGSEISQYLDLYSFYIAYYFSDLYKTDLDSYNWCVGILNDEERWLKYF